MLNSRTLRPIRSQWSPQQIAGWLKTTYPE